MLIEALLVKTQNWKQTKCQSTGKGINNGIFIKQKNTAIKRSKLVTHMATWIYHKISMLSERNQIKKNIALLIFYKIPKNTT